MVVFRVILVTAMFVLLTPAAGFGDAEQDECLPNTHPLNHTRDIASQLVSGVDAFLLKQIDKSVAMRGRHWNRGFSSIAAYNRSIESNRERLKFIIGARDQRAAFESPELVVAVGKSQLIAEGDGFDVFAIRWPAIAGVHGEGLLLMPKNQKPIANIIAIPDCDQTPEQCVGLIEGVARESQFARRLAENGCCVIVPTLINRQDHGK